MLRFAASVYMDDRPPVWSATRCSVAACWCMSLSSSLHHLVFNPSRVCGDNVAIYSSRGNDTSCCFQIHGICQENPTCRTSLHPGGARYTRQCSCQEHSSVTGVDTVVFVAIALEISFSRATEKRLQNFMGQTLRRVDAQPTAVGSY